MTGFIVEVKAPIIKKKKNTRKNIKLLKAVKSQINR